MPWVHQTYRQSDVGVKLESGAEFGILPVRDDRVGAVDIATDQVLEPRSTGTRRSRSRLRCRII